MAGNLWEDNMKKSEAVSYWRTHILPAVKQEFESDGIPDYPARCESWNAYTDGLCKDRQITMHQYDTWSTPPECEKRRK
jgi:hypothetical protein